MIQIGKKQELIVVKQVDFGVYLADSMESEERVLLPQKQVPKDIKLHDKVEVFVYKDSSDRIISTTATPKLQISEIGMLTVVDVGKIGAFLDWGLEKDLFLPFKEQTKRVKQGEKCLVAVYLDKSSRLCATMNVYEYLELDSPYQKNDKVTGTVYETSDEFGLFVAVDNRYSALIPRKEMYGELCIGDTVEARVVRVKEDGKLDLAVREKAYLQMDQDAERIVEAMRQNGGKLKFTDKADPEIIKKEMQMSKAAFKRAVGRLLKNGQIEIVENSIRIKTGS